MKNFIKITFLSLVSLILFSGCFEETAADATENFFYSVKEGNVEDYHKYSTESIPVMSKTKQRQESKKTIYEKKCEVREES